MNELVKEDCKNFADTFKLASDLENVSFLVTGATGLIGSTLVRCLLSLNRNIRITCPVRNLQKASELFCEESDKVNLIKTELIDYVSSLTSDQQFDYIVHCASPTSGQFMVAHPVETYELSIISTRSLLDFARRSNVRGFVYLSSLEYYGQITDDRVITEDMLGYIDLDAPRSSYPIGKRSAEFLCKMYAKEYGVNVRIARLTQTFGAGVSKDDNRVFAQFARSVLSGENIVLHTTGESSKPYCYTTDCISAILYILLKGHNGESYNVANSETYISIKDLANFLIEKFNQNISVVVDLSGDVGYAPVTKLNLSTDKLKSLGWSPTMDLFRMFDNLLKSFQY